MYHEGPAMLGNMTTKIGYDAADEALRLARSNNIEGRRLFVLLCGWSRGGAACVKAAERLLAADAGVSALFLFDAVDEALFQDFLLIPGGVEMAYHAISSKDANSQPRWNRTALAHASGASHLRIKEFHASHSALGLAGGTDGITQGRPYTPAHFTTADRAPNRNTGSFALSATSNYTDSIVGWQAYSWMLDNLEKETCKLREMLKPQIFDKPTQLV
ncbi:MAG: hypothetical protein ACU0CO_15995 [Shimia sp.]